MAIGPLVALILAVLGSIFFGIASPTEAAGTGALATIILAAANRRLNMEILKKAAGIAPGGVWISRLTSVDHARLFLYGDIHAGGLR